MARVRRKYNLSKALRSIFQFNFEILVSLWHQNRYLFPPLESFLDE